VLGELKAAASVPVLIDLLKVKDQDPGLSSAAVKY